VIGGSKKNQSQPLQERQDCGCLIMSDLKSVVLQNDPGSFRCNFQLDIVVFEEFRIVKTLSVLYHTPHFKFTSIRSMSGQAQAHFTKVRTVCFF
jgi:hypothetical protein